MKKKRIIILITILLIIVSVILFLGLSNKHKKLVCKASEGEVTIIYNKNRIIDYKAKGINYDLETQKEFAKEVGIKEYIKLYKTFFQSNTSGTCE